MHGTDDALVGQALHPRRTLGTEPVAPAMFAHFVVRTANYAAMKAWYLTVLNARIVHEADGLCFITYDDEHHRLAIRHVPGLEAPSARAWGLAHLAYSYATLGDLLSTYRRLAGLGIVPYWPIRHGPTVSLYYRDPDGTAIELQVDAFPEKAAASAYVHGPEFAANPIGVTFDPEELVRSWEAGVPEEVLLRRPALPAGRTPADMLPA